MDGVEVITIMAICDHAVNTRIIFDPDGIGAGRVVLDTNVHEVIEESAVEPDCRLVDADIEVQANGQVTVNTTRLAADPSRIADLFTTYDGHDVIIGLMYSNGGTESGFDLPNVNMLNYVDTPLPDQGDQSTNKETLRFRSISMVDLEDWTRVRKRSPTV